METGVVRHQRNQDSGTQRDAHIMARQRVTQKLIPTTTIFHAIAGHCQDIFFRLWQSTGWLRGIQTRVNGTPVDTLVGVRTVGREFFGIQWGCGMHRANVQTAEAEGFLIFGNKKW